MSWRVKSTEALESTIPVNPPVVNRKINPTIYNLTLLNFTLEAVRVKSQLKTLTPVGMAIIIVAAEKYARVSKSIPTVNM